MKATIQTCNRLAVRGALAALLVSMALPSTIANHSPLLAQEASAGPSASAVVAPVPRLIRFSGILVDGRGWPITTPTNVAFSIHSQLSGDDQPLWQETQQISPGSKGGYTVLLGAASSNGVPAEIFQSGGSQYLAVKAEGEPEQARVLLASVPYALKAADASTLGGLPATAFALAGPTGKAAVAPGIVPEAGGAVTTTGGTAGYLAEFTGGTTIADSPVFVTSTGVGIGTTTPSAELEVEGNTVVNGGVTVNGGSTFNGQFLLPAPGVATRTTSYNSQLIKIYTSAYNSSTNAAVTPRFEWVGEVTGNDTASPGATLNLLSSATSAVPSETGFHFNLNGTLNFAPGQTFPGTGTGTITGVSAGTALTGGGTSGAVTLNLDTTKVPLLAANNAFTGSETVAGSLSAASLAVAGTASAGTVNATTGFDLGGTLFAFGSATNGNAFLGFAGNTSTTGTYNTASGYQALYSDTTGGDNTASGYLALFSNTTGSYNTASGQVALYSNTTGGYNTASGSYALESNTTGTYNTASGNGALYLNSTGSSNTASGVAALSYNTTGSNNTAAGFEALTYNTTGSYNAANGDTSLLYNTTGGNNAANGAGALSQNTTGSFNSASGTNALTGNTTGSYNSALGYDAGPGSGNLANTTALGYNATVSQSNTLVLGQTAQGSPGAPYVNVGIGTDTPRSILEAAVESSGALGPVLTLTNTGGNSGAASAVDFNTYAPSTSGTYNPAARIAALDDNFADDIAFLANVQGKANQGLQTNMTIYPDGNVSVRGTLSAAAKNFQIDDPLDPQNKYLVHTSVESSEMMNIYSGNVTTDELGLATVALPAWFEAENADFRYQLTTIGRDAHAWIAKEVGNKQFQIATNASNVKVSWQITAVRQDAYAKAHPLVVEQVKPASERAGAAHPEFGQPASAVDRVFEHPAPPEPKAPEGALPAPRVHPAARPAVGIAGAAR